MAGTEGTTTTRAERDDLRAQMASCRTVQAIDDFIRSLEPRAEDPEINGLLRTAGRIRDLLAHPPQLA